MGEKITNSIIASIIGCISAIGMVWFLSDNSPEDTAPSIPANVQEVGRFASLQANVLQADQIQLTGSLIIVDSQTGQPIIELRDGIAWVRNGIYSDRIGAAGIVGQKIQLTRDNPTSENCRVAGEMAVHTDGGARFSLLSSQGTHSINLGFDTKETGYIISQNNADQSIKAQVIMAIPHADDAAHANRPSGIAESNRPKDKAPAAADPLKQEELAKQEALPPQTATAPTGVPR